MSTARSLTPPCPSSVRRVRFGAVVLSTAVLMATPIHATSPGRPLPRDPHDQAEYEMLIAGTPEFAELIRASDTAAAAYRWSEGAEKLRRAMDLAPRKTALLSRRYCEVLSRAGRQTEALEACHEALGLRAGPAELRETVRALVQSGHPPTSEQLAEALWLISTLRRVHRTTVHRLAAECDISAALGDWQAFSEYAQQLNAVEAGHPEALAATTLLATKRQGWYCTLGWATFFALILFPLAGFRRRSWIRGTRPFRVSTLATLIPIGLGLAIALAHRPAIASAAEDYPKGLSAFPINDRDPERSVPSDAEKDRDPLNFGYLIMDLTDRAEIARKRGDLAATIRYYSALAKAVPDRAVAFSKLCAAYQDHHEPQNAIEACRKALQLEGVKVDDYSRFVDLLLARKDPPTAVELNEINGVVQHLRAQLADGRAAAHVECKLALRIRDEARMRHCTEHLAQVAANDPQTISFQWAYALMRGDFKAARAHIQSAKEIQVASEVIRSMEEATERAVPIWHSVSKHGWLLATFGVIGLFCVAVWLGARRRERTIDTVRAMT